MSIEIPAELQSFVREQIQLVERFNTSRSNAVAERDESLAGIRTGLADAAAGRVQPLAEAFADVRREFNLPDPK